jgi:hypothetical protein
MAYLRPSPRATRLRFPSLVIFDSQQAEGAMTK